METQIRQIRDMNIDKWAINEVVRSLVNVRLITMGNALFKEISTEYVNVFGKPIRGNETDQEIKDLADYLMFRLNIINVTSNYH